MEVGGQHHAPAGLPPEKNPWNSPKSMQSAPPEPVWTIWRRKKNILAPPGFERRIDQPTPSSPYRRRYLGSKGGEFPDRLSHYHNLRGTLLNADSHTAIRNDTSANRRYTAVKKPLVQIH